MCKDNHFVALFIPLRLPFSAAQDCTSALPMWDGQKTEEADECKCCYTHPPLDALFSYNCIFSLFFSLFPYSMEKAFSAYT